MPLIQRARQLTEPSMHHVTLTYTPPFCAVCLCVSERWLWKSHSREMWDRPVTLRLGSIDHYKWPADSQMSQPEIYCGWATGRRLQRQIKHVYNQHSCFCPAITLYQWLIMILSLSFSKFKVWSIVNSTKLSSAHTENWKCITLRLLLKTSKKHEIMSTNKLLHTK